MYETLQFKSDSVIGSLEYGSDDQIKYPFLDDRATGGFVRRADFSISELIDPTYKRVVQRAKQRIEEAIRAGRVSTRTDKDREVEVLSFPAALMLVRLTKLDHLMNSYALAEAIRVESFLSKENREQMVENVFRSFLNLKVENTPVKGFDFRIDVSSYLKRATRIRDSKWRLINRVVENGRVMMLREELARLIREEMKDTILQRLRSTNISRVPEELDGVVKDLISQVPPPRPSFAALKIGPEDYPPCLKKALSLLEKGENVPHYGRFLMATYLLAAGKTVEEIMEIFPKSPDFKKSVTQYQVEHIAGMKGGHTKYSVPSCKTLQTHSFCFKDPLKCYEITSPLQYPSKKIPVSGDKGSSKTQGREEKRRDWTRTRR
jgi:DNA primase large subunit